MHLWTRRHFVVLVTTFASLLLGTGASANPQAASESTLRQVAELEQLMHEFGCGLEPTIHCVKQRQRLARLLALHSLEIQATPEISPQPLAKGLAGISGTVTSAADGSPLAARVWLRRVGGGGTSVRTNSAGEFLAELPPATYRAVAQPDGPFRAELYDDLPCPHLHCDADAGIPLVVSPEKLVTGIDFTLEPGGAISGQVTDKATGAGIPDDRIFLFDVFGEILEWDYTDSDGNYSFGGLPSADYLLLATSVGLYREVLYDNITCPVTIICNVLDGDRVAVTTGATTSNVDFALTAISGVTGQVNEFPGDTPVPNPLIHVWDSSGQFAESDLARFDGSYVIALDPGTYFLTASAAGIFQGELYDDLYCPLPFECEATLGTPVIVGSEPGQNVVNGIDFVLERAGSIEGTVSAESAPLSTLIEVWDAEGRRVGRVVSSSVDGSFAVNGLRSGDHFVTAQDSANYLGELYNDLPCTGGSCEPVSGTAVSVSAPATTSGIHFDLQPGTGISGRVTDGSGAPLSGLGIQFWDLDGVVAETGVTNSSGNFGELLAPGSYFVITDGENGGWADEVYDDIPCYLGNCDPDTGQRVIVSAGITPNIDFELQPSGGLAGRVRDQNTLAPLSFFTLEILDSNGSLVTTELSAPDGTYSVEGLAPGAYFVRVRSQDFYLGELWNDVPCPGNCPVTSGSPVVVGPNSMTPNIDFDLDGSHGVSGEITNAANGKPLDGIAVEAYDTDGNWVASGRSSNGPYKVAVPPGTYFLRASGLESYFSELYDDLPCEPSCDVTEGLPITVSQATRDIVANIDFSLVGGGRVSGSLSSDKVLAGGGTSQAQARASGFSSDQGAKTQEYRESFEISQRRAGEKAPLAARLDFYHSLLGPDFHYGNLEIWDAAGQLVATFRRAIGFPYSVGPLAAGNYFATFRPEDPALGGGLFDGQDCFGSCDPTAGTPIPVLVGGIASAVDFYSPWAPSTIFLDGFEAGNTDAWSASETP